MSALIYDAEAEEIVLGTCFGPGVDKAHVAEIVELLDADDFEPSNHRAIFRAIKGAFLDGEPLESPHTVLTRLRRSGDEQASGGALKLHDLLHHAPSAASGRHHVRTVKWASRLRDWARLQMSELNTEDEMAEVAQIAHELLHDLRGGSLKLPSPIHAEIDGAFDLFESHSDTPSGIFSGLRRLDEVTGGFHPGQLVIVGARTSVGKTSLLSQLAVAAAKQNAHVLFVSLEMPTAQVTHRILGQESNVPIQRMTNPSHLEDTDWVKMTQARAVMPGGIWITDGAFQIDALIAKVRRAHAQVGINVVCVDYVQLIQGTERGNRTQEVGEVSRALKALATELGICVITASQLSRAHEHDKRVPTLKDLRESGSLEHDADVVVLLHRKETDGQLSSIFPTDLIVAKNRNGATGSTETMFNAPLNRFEEAGR